GRRGDRAAPQRDCPSGGGDLSGVRGQDMGRITDLGGGGCWSSSKPAQRKDDTMTITNPARERLQNGKLAIGIGLRQARTVDTALAMKACGFDWLFIDLEHGSMGLDTAAQISMAALGAGISPLVRVPKGCYDLATRVLDCGAYGIVMPHVDTAEEARDIVDHLKYPPLGHRSAAGAMAQLAFKATPLVEATATVNDNMLIVAMLETPAAIANADAIAAVPGIDVLLIGTNDLTCEMG